MNKKEIIVDLASMMLSNGNSYYDNCKYVRERLDQLEQSIIEECVKDIQEIQNPYPESVFPMTTKEYVMAIPDEHLRTTISGYCGRLFWNLAMKEAIIHLKNKG